MFQVPRRPRTASLVPQDDNFQETYKRPTLSPLRRAAIAAKDTQALPAHLPIPKVSGPLHVVPPAVVPQRQNPITPIPPLNDDWLRAPAPEPVVLKNPAASTIDLVFLAIDAFISMHRSMPTQLVFGKAIRRLEMCQNEYHLPGTSHVIKVSCEPGDYDVIMR